MYSRDFGGSISEGQLYNLEREYKEAQSREAFSPPPPPPLEEQKRSVPEEREPQKGLRTDFLRNLKLDDLLLIAIGILLLLDSDSENDIFVFLMAFLLMF